MSGTDRTVDGLLAEWAVDPLLDPPRQVVLGWHRALAQLPPPVAPPGRAARRGGGRRGLVAFAAAASVAGLLMIVAPAAAPSASAPSASAPSARAVAPWPGAGRVSPRALGEVDPGHLDGLGDAGRQAGCLARVGLPGATVLDARRVRWRGQQAVRLLLATPVPGRFRGVTVTPDCGPDTGRRLADR